MMLLNQHLGLILEINEGNYDHSARLSCFSSARASESHKVYIYDVRHS